MTAVEYRAVIKALGLTPTKPSYEGATIHQDREGVFHSIPDGDTLDEDERVAFLDILKSRLGIVIQ